MRRGCILKTVNKQIRMRHSPSKRSWFYDRDESRKVMNFTFDIPDITKLNLVRSIGSMTKMNLARFERNG